MSAILVAALFVFLILLSMPVVLYAGVVRWRSRRQRRRLQPGREYEQEPPSSLPPALAGALLTMGDVREDHLLATVLDLARRDVVSIDGSVDDPTIVGFGDASPLTPHERAALNIVTAASGGRPLPLAGLAAEIHRERETTAPEWRAFRNAVLGELRDRRLLDLSARLLVAAGIGLGLFVTQISGSITFNSVTVPAWLPFIVVNGFAAWRLLRRPSNYARWTDAGVREAERWKSFHRYLETFTRLDDAKLAEFPLWDRYFAHAVAFGTAERTIEFVRLKAPRAIFRGAGEAVESATRQIVDRLEERGVLASADDPMVLARFVGKWFGTHTPIVDPTAGMAPSESHAVEAVSSAELPEPLPHRSGHETTVDVAPTGEPASDHGAEESPRGLLDADQLRALGRDRARARLEQSGFVRGDVDRLLGILFAD